MCDNIVNKIRQIIKKRDDARKLSYPEYWRVVTKTDGEFVELVKKLLESLK